MLSRAVYKKQRGRGFLTALATLGLVAGTLLTASTALAVHDAGLFELDTSSTASVCAPLPTPCGNANTVDTAALGDDWATIYAGGGPANTSFITDKNGSLEDSFYTGGGSKDVRDIPAWQYGTTNDPVPDKDDLSHAFAAAYIDPADDHTIIYFGVDRYDNNGDAETGFWFFQDLVSLDGSGHFTGVHSEGDVLVLADWGGSNPVGAITVYHWVGGKNPLVLDFDSTSGDCATAGVNDNVCAVVNRQIDAQPWPFLDKSGSTSIRPLELFEAGLDVNALFGEERCFASFLAATRSSHSTTAQLKDFTLDTFEQCGASIATQVSDDSIEPGGSVTDDATVTVNGPAPTGTVQFSSNFNGGAFSNLGDPVDLADAVVDEEEGTYTVTSEALSPTVPGTYCFSATWGGDDNYTDDPYTDDGTNECFEVVVFQPELDTAQTVTIKDTATITDGGGGGALAGTVHFEAFTAAGCDAADAIAGSAEDVGVGGDSPQDASTTPMTITDPGGTVWWNVSYTSNNNAQADIAATCTENSTITIND